jgi:hypothetical protein
LALSLCVALGFNTSELWALHGVGRSIRRIVPRHLLAASANRVKPGKITKITLQRICYLILVIERHIGNDRRVCVRSIPIRIDPL